MPRFLEILGNTVFEFFSFAYINDTIGLISHNVDTGLKRKT